MLLDVVDKENANGAKLQRLLAEHEHEAGVLAQVRIRDAEVRAEFDPSTWAIFLELPLVEDGDKFPKNQSN